MLATAILALAYTDGASDAGLTVLGAVSAGVAALLMVVTAADRSLRARSAE
ncbi:hypothetical protein [Pseudonocardia sp. NPDC046786]|uniref:hypothetical protein n=1 Tax=Pseudonocardia sp. NPDC046786 TaxID=3155471 RepID=UPI0033CB2128